MRWLRAFFSLWFLSLSRLVWSINTVIVLLPLSAGAMFLLRRSYSRRPMNFENFSEFLIVVFVSFLIPICAIAYGSTSIGGDREDRTLVFLLIRPIPRALILFGKFMASWPLTVFLVVGSFAVYCSLLGSVGVTAFELYWPAMILMTTAYVSLFHFFAVWFRHATILALLYALFMELLIGSMPGIVKRVAINYYGRSLIFAAGKPHGLRTPDARWFELLEPSTAQWALVGIATTLLLAAMLVFHRREYRDLT